MASKLSERDRGGRVLAFGLLLCSDRESCDLGGSERMQRAAIGLSGIIVGVVMTLLASGLGVPFASAEASWLHAGKNAEGRMTIGGFGHY